MTVVAPLPTAIFHLYIVLEVTHLDIRLMILTNLPGFKPLSFTSKRGTWMA